MAADDICFEKNIPGSGVFGLRPFDLVRDAALIHSWVTLPYARYWGMQHCSPEEVADAYAAILRTTRVFLGLHAGRPQFLLEWYHARDEPIAAHFDAQPGDHGMHVLVAPAERRLGNFTWHVFTTILDFMFSSPSVDRIVVEPDVHNQKIHALNRRAGFVYQKTIELPNKTASLAFCTRRQYAAALELQETTSMKHSTASHDERSTAHLTPEIWRLVNARHLLKAIAEFCHERLLRPRPIGSAKAAPPAGEWADYELATDDPFVHYQFRARIGSLEHWQIAPESLIKLAHGSPAPLDSLRFIIELRETLGLSPAVLPTYLEEIQSTLYGAAFKYDNQRFTADELVHAGFQEVETSMTDGHPIFVANNGRIGFDIADHSRYSPEAASPVHLLWLAAHQSCAVVSSIEGLDYAELTAAELGAQSQRFAAKLRSQGREPNNYFLIPVHPWQWNNKLATIFASDIANGMLVYLGPGEDAHLAQQSVRTFFNVNYPAKCYVKTALSVLNMGFMRGLSPYYMRTTPAINEWIDRLLESDAYLRRTGFGILREIAAIGYANRYYEAAIQGDTPYKKMLAALYRESPLPRLAPGQRLMTMASLLHRDRDGHALLAALVRASELSPERWLQSYLRCYLAPLLHCFYAHDLVFMPHGENLILVLENAVPVRAFMKDVAEEAALLNTDITLPENVKRLSVKIPPELEVLSIFTDVFDCFFRHLCQIALEHLDLPERAFWRLVADCVHDYRESQPDLAHKFRRRDLFAPEFARSCLNRLQIGNNQQMIDLSDPAKNLKFAGTLENPIAGLEAAADRAALGAGEQRIRSC